MGHGWGRSGGLVWGRSVSGVRMGRGLCCLKQSVRYSSDFLLAYLFFYCFVFFYVSDIFFFLCWIFFRRGPWSACEWFDLIELRARGPSAPCWGWVVVIHSQITSNCFKQTLFLSVRWQKKNRRPPPPLTVNWCGKQEKVSLSYRPKLEKESEVIS